MEINVEADFTLQDLMAFLAGEAVGPGPEMGYRTAREWAEHFSVPVKRMRELLQRCKKAGALKVAKGHRERIDGSTNVVPVYALNFGPQSEE